MTPAASDAVRRQQGAFTAPAGARTCAVRCAIAPCPPAARSRRGSGPAGSGSELTGEGVFQRGLVGGQPGDDPGVPVASRADALRRGREDDPVRAREQQSLVVRRVGVPAQEELARAAVPVAVEDVVEAALLHSGLHALLVLLLGPVPCLLLLRVQGTLHSLLPAGQKAQEKEEREERGAEHGGDQGQRRSAGRADRWVARGSQNVGRRLRNFPDPAPFACFGMDVEAFRDSALFAPACHVNDLLADAEPDRSTESISCA